MVTIDTETGRISATEGVSHGLACGIYIGGWDSGNGSTSCCTIGNTRSAKLDITRGNVADIGDGDGKVFVEWMVIAIGYGNGGAETGGSFIV